MITGINLYINILIVAIIPIIPCKDNNYLCSENVWRLFQIGESEQLTPFTKPKFSLEDLLKEMRSLTHYAEGGSREDQEKREELLSNKRLLEGDLLISSKYVLQKIFQEDKGLFMAESNIGTPWPNATVPFAFQDSFTLTEQVVVALAMDEIQTKSSCIRFKMRDTEESYIQFYKSDGCASHVGFQGGIQGLSLSDDCLKYQSIILHHLMHALGFWHENSRADRDDYIDVKWRNVDPNNTCNYRKFRWLPKESLKYDPQSILHFSQKRFAKAKNVPAFEFLEFIPESSTGEPPRLSDADIKKLISKYNCYRRNWQEKMPEPRSKKIIIHSPLGRSFEMDRDKAFESGPAKVFPTEGNVVVIVAPPKKGTNNVASVRKHNPIETRTIIEESGSARAEQAASNIIFFIVHVSLYFVIHNIYSS